MAHCGDFFFKKKTMDLSQDTLRNGWTCCVLCFCCCCPFCNRKYSNSWYLNKWITLKTLINTQVSHFSVILQCFDGLKVFAPSPQSTPFFTQPYDLVYRMISIVLLGYILQTYWSLWATNVHKIGLIKNTGTNIRAKPRHKRHTVKYNIHSQFYCFFHR